MRRALLAPSMAPVGRAPAVTSPRAVGGSPHTVQCTNVPPGASGSPTKIATSAAFAGTPAHDSVGRAPAPSQVNCLGITPPLRKLALATASGVVPTSEVPASPGVPPEDPQPATESARKTAHATSLK